MKARDDGSTPGPGPGQHEQHLDALVREAAMTRADEAATQRAVMERIGPARQPWWRAIDLDALLPTLDVRLAAPALTVMLVGAGVAGYALPEIVGGMEAIRLLDLAAGGLTSGEGGHRALDDWGRAG
ncbi:MAG: hypothetical protein AAFQ88_03195 [Pseudomonadota bacterium]